MSDRTLTAYVKEKANLMKRVFFNGIEMKIVSNNMIGSKNNRPALDCSIVSSIAIMQVSVCIVGFSSDNISILSISPAPTRGHDEISKKEGSIQKAGQRPLLPAVGPWIRASKDGGGTVE
jgi:hypothetical protein